MTGGAAIGGTLVSTLVTGAGYGVAAGVGTFGANRVVEATAGKNLLRDNVFGGNEQVFNNTELLFNLAGTGMVIGAAGLPQIASKSTTNNNDYDSDSNENIVYRSLNQKDVERLQKGLGLEAKNPNGTWELDEHLINGSGKKSWLNDPFISTTTDINVARGFNQSGSNLGIIKIDLNKVPSEYLKGYEIYQRVNGVEGLSYHYSIWQQEVSIYKTIPIEAIKGFVQ